MTAEQDPLVLALAKLVREVFEDREKRRRNLVLVEGGKQERRVA